MNARQKASIALSEARLKAIEDNNEKQVTAFLDFKIGNGRTLSDLKVSNDVCAPRY
jgi:hypothetical protein